MRHRIVTAIAAALLATSVPLAAAKAPDTWDGLLKVPSTRLQLVYLLPDADFRGYTKVMLDPVEASFRRNWQRDQNRSTAMSLSSRVSDQDARRIITAAQEGFDTILAKAFQDAGYQVVTEPGPDVLRISTAIINLDVTAPDVMSSGRSRTFSRTAGSATLVLEAKDSVTGETLGRAVDARETDDMGPAIRNRVTNTADFQRVFTRWANTSAAGLGELKSLSPINADGIQQR